MLKFVEKFAYINKPAVCLQCSNDERRSFKFCKKFDGQPIILIYPKPLQKTTDGTLEIMPSNK